MRRITENCDYQLSKEMIQRILVVAPEGFCATPMVYEIPFRHLSDYCIDWRIVSESSLNYQDLEQVDLLILYRCIRGSTLSIVNLARQKEIKIIYELDDDLLNPPVNEGWGKFYHKSQLSQIINIFLSKADLVKAGSEELKRRLEKRGYPAVYQPYAAKIIDIPDNKDNQPSRIGYFGSPHHQDDIEMIFPALKAVKDQCQHEVEFEFIGCYPQGWRQLDARVFPFELNYETFLDKLAKRCWSIGLAPLRINPFNEAKSDSKFRDYTAAGIIGIYTNCTPYRESVVNGHNGWFCANTLSGWLDTIKNALSSPDYPVMLNRAREGVLTPESVARNWLELIKLLIKR